MHPRRSAPFTFIHTERDLEPHQATAMYFSLCRQAETATWKHSNRTHMDPSKSMGQWASCGRSESLTSFTCWVVCLRPWAISRVLSVLSLWLSHFEVSLGIPKVPTRTEAFHKHLKHWRSIPWWKPAMHGQIKNRCSAFATFCRKFQIHIIGSCLLVCVEGLCYYV